MGCGSVDLRMDGKVFRQEKIELDINNIYKSKELSQAQLLINLITILRNNIIYEFDNLIFITGACLFKNPDMSHCTKCILFKICSESKGDIKNTEFIYNEDLPFFKLNKMEDFSQETNDLISKLFDFIGKLRDYKIILRQLDKEIPKLMYIVFENNNKISKENIDKINKAILLFKNLSDFRTKIIKQYKNQISDLAIGNSDFYNQINTIGKLAYEKKITDVYEIAMLCKKNIKENKAFNCNNREEWEMHNDINGAKKNMEKKLQSEKFEKVDSPLLRSSLINTKESDYNNENDKKESLFQK
jgi:hypothetical protein